MECLFITKMDIKLVFLVLSCIFGAAFGSLRCYSCAFSSTESDTSCLTITNQTATVECRFQYCTIYRQDFVDPAGVTVSFLRGCEQVPDFINNDVTDSNFRTYYRACTTDLCNIGDGIESVAGNELSPRPQYDGENLLVPGTGNNALNLKTNVMAIVFCALLLNYSR